MAVSAFVHVELWIVYICVYRLFWMNKKREENRYRPFSLKTKPSKFSKKKLYIFFSNILFFGAFYRIQSDTEHIYTFLVHVCLTTSNFCDCSWLIQSIQYKLDLFDAKLMFLFPLLLVAFKKVIQTRTYRINSSNYH